MRKLLLIVLIPLFLLALSFRQPVIVGYKFLGFDRPKEYIILLQNNMELRPTGGFMGSFARVRFDRGNLSLLKIEDIYVPDGQLDGHVDPPWPIQAAFGQGWYKLRDSNWDPDFPTSAKTIEWFFEKGKEPKGDGLIAVNLTLLQELLKLTGPIYIVDEPEKITYENFYKKTQTAVEQDFFPGSSQKRDFLSKLGRAVFDKIIHLSFAEKLRLPFLGLKLLKEKQILIYSHDSQVQAFVERSKFAGQLTNISGKNQDYLALFEANLGSNKANCCIQRELALKTEAQPGMLRRELVIRYHNTNPATMKQPPQYWGGAYVNFLRVGLPLEAKVIAINNGGVDYPTPVVGGTIDLMGGTSDEELRQFVSGADTSHLRVDLDRREALGIQFIGFFVVVDALNSKEVKITYSLPVAFSSSRLVYEKQSGMDSVPILVQE